VIRNRILSGVSAFLLGCVVFPIVTLARPPVYRVVEIGTLGGERSEARGIGDGGHVVGWSETGVVDTHGNTIRHAFLWCDGELTDLGTLGGFQSEAYAVNGSGQVVGWADTPVGARHAFLWLPEPAFGLSAGMNDLNPVGSHRYEYATDINDRGEILGPLYAPFYVWLPNAAYSLSAGLHELDCTAYNCPDDLLYYEPHLNNHLQVVAGTWIWLPVPTYGMNAGWTRLPGFAAEVSYVGDLNDMGLVIGNSVDLARPLLSLFDSARGSWFTSRIQDSWGTGINDRGVVVGYAGHPRRPFYVELTANNGANHWELDGRAVYGTVCCGLPSGINNRSQIVMSPAHVWDPVDTNVIGGVRPTYPQNVRFFVRNMPGPNEALTPQCPRCDIDGDSDADLADFQALQLAFEP